MSTETPAQILNREVLVDKICKGFIRPNMLQAYVTH